MINISKYIVELLYLNDCVIIPEFGGFITNYKPSSVNSNNHFFNPPTKQILFNKTLNDNDGLLISVINKKEKIQYNQAKQQVANYVNHINNQLINHNFYTINNIGTFSIDANKNLVFEPDITPNLLADSYGLGGFHFPQLEKKEPVKHIKEKFKNKKSIQQVIKQPITKKIIIGLPLAIILSILPFKSNFIEKQNYVEANFLYNLQSSYDVNLENPNNILDVVENIAKKENALLYIEPFTPIEDKNIENKEIIINENNKDIAKKEVDADISSIVNNKKNDKYFIIAGSFAEKQRAKNFCNNIKEKGYKPTILDRQNGRLRVSIDSFAEKTEADNALNKYKKDSKLSLWLLTR